MDHKLDKIQEDITAIKVTLAVMSRDVERNTDDLEEHMAQTRALKQEMNNRVSPIEDHIRMLSNWKVLVVMVGSIVMWAVTMVATVYGVMK